MNRHVRIFKTDDLVAVARLQATLCQVCLKSKFSYILLSDAGVKRICKSCAIALAASDCLEIEDTDALNS